MKRIEDMKRGQPWRRGKLSDFGRVLSAAMIAGTLFSAPATGAQTTTGFGPLDEPALGHVNDQTPDWLTLSGDFRLRFESRKGLGFVDGNDDSYGLARTRLNVGIQAGPWVRFFVQAQDSRAPGIRPDASNNGVFRDEADLRQAHVRFGGAESDPVALTVGRQLLLFGDQRLVGPLDWTNTSRTWDAVRLELRPRSDWKFDVFASSVVANTPGMQINRSVDGVNFHGVYGSMGGLIPNATIEPFLLWRTAPLVVGEDGFAGDMDRYSVGFRVAGAGGGFDYNATLVDQWGDMAGSSIDAWAYSLGGGYTFDAPLAPRVYTEYNFGSGDSDPTDGEVGSFDDNYPTAHLFYGYNDLVGWRNIKNLRIGTEVAIKRVTVRIDYHGFWLDDTGDDLYNVAGALAVDGNGTETRVGDEVDLTVSLPITPTVSAGGGIGHMFPGPFLEANTQGAENTFSYLFFGYRF
jgi:hypothetical protein